MHRWRTQRKNLNFKIFEVHTAVLMDVTPCQSNPSTRCDSQKLLNRPVRVYYTHLPGVNEQDHMQVI
jgi:hypothetical protein